MLQLEDSQRGRKNIRPDFDSEALIHRGSNTVFRHV